MEYRKRPRRKELKDQVEEQVKKRRWKSGIQKEAKMERAKRPGRRTSEKEEMEKWNTEKGQDGKS